MLRIMLGAATAWMVLAFAAAAQDYSHVLADGRTVIVPSAATDICEAPTPEDDPRYAYVLSFTCRDDDVPMAGNGFIGVGRQPGETSPREYMHQVTEQFWPDETRAQRDERILASRVEFGGGTHDFLCMVGEDPVARWAEATCVLDQPRTQVIVSAESDTAEHAYGVMLMFLTRATIR